MDKVVQTFIDGCTYAGSIRHSALNYALIFITVLPYLVAGNGKRENRSAWWPVLMTSIFVQVLLWFSVGAVGVSVIWSSMAGFNLLVFRKNISYANSKTVVVFTVSFIAALLAIIYYAVILPPITTAAHIIAVLMGIGLFYLYRSLFNKYKLR